MTDLRRRWGGIPRAGRIALTVGAVLLVLWLVRVPLLVGVAGVLDVGETPVRADLIYVLGGDVEARTQRAAELYAAGYAPRILLTWVVESRTARLGLVPGETELAVGLLVASGVPRSAIVVIRGGDGVSSTTEEGEQLRAYFRRHPISRMIAVTTNYHTRRARWALRRALADVPVEIVMVSAPDPNFDETNWWRREVGMIRVLEEYLKFAHNWAFR